MTLNTYKKLEYTNEGYFHTGFTLGVVLILLATPFIKTWWIVLIAFLVTDQIIYRISTRVKK